MTPNLPSTAPQLPFSQACENNQAAIFEVLQSALQHCRHVLEIGSGTGQHSVYFAPRLPQLIWQTSDLAENHPGIRAWQAAHPAPNLRAPLLLWLLPRLRSMSAPAMDAGDKVYAERRSVLWFSLAGLAVLIIASFAALSFGRDAVGWHWATGDLLNELVQWRWPRIFAALIAGVMLAVAGCIIQRLTGNPMASPEVLGISSGAAFGVVLMLFFVPGNAFGWLMPAGSIGAAVTLMIILIAAGRGGFSPHRMLLAGMALSTAFTMLLMMLQASGDPRMAKILTWISGSTYNATGSQVVWSGIAMLVLLAMVPLCRRWMTILPLGGETARAVGMALTPARVALLLLAACLTAVATLTIGPLSFVGLMAPHIARMMGFRRTMPHIVMSALTGGMMLVFADWCGRMVLFPYQIPAGLLSTFIGAPYFIYLLRKQSR